METYERPEFLDATESVENLTDAIRNTIQVWLDFHTDPIAWADGWAVGEYTNLLETSPIISNNYFTFDLRNACNILQAETMLTDFVKCSKCGTILDTYYDCEECEDSEMVELTVDDLDYLVDWVEQVGFDVDEDIIQTVLITDAFSAYTDALWGTISGVVEECQTAIQMFENATSNMDILTAAMSASSILHVNGHILEDYGEDQGLEYNTVCTYRDEGLTALFEREEIMDFMTA